MKGRSVTARLAVLGAGSWGTTMAKVLAEAGAREVQLWARRADVCDEINTAHRNSSYLPDVELPSTIRASSDAAQVLRGATHVVLAVPAQSLRENLDQWRGFIEQDAVLVSLAKGIELGTGRRMSQVIAESLDAEPSRIAVLSGPNLAREIAVGQPTATVIACSDAKQAERFAQLARSGRFRPYWQDDVIGTEIGGAVKNVIALAVGVAAGLGLGHNTRASVITRGLAETTRLAAALGGRAETMAGLSGLGDLVATCSSPLSRNHTVGVRLGQGERLDVVQTSIGQVAEGVKSAAPIVDLASEHGIEMPICQQVVRLIGGEADPAEVMERLLRRDLKDELTGQPTTGQP